MKKVLFMLAAMFFAMPANAQESVMGVSEGYMGPASEGIITVEEIKNLDDGSNIILVGMIVQSLGDDKYMFKDNTGTIMVEIDEEEWNGNTYSAEESIQIFGEVDHESEGTKVDVNKLVKVNAKK